MIFLCKKACADLFTVYGGVYMLSDAYSDSEIRDTLKIRLQKIETEVKRLQEEISRLEGEKKQILSQIADHSDAAYEENMLQLVYEQRHKK